MTNDDPTAMPGGLTPRLVVTLSIAMPTIRPVDLEGPGGVAFAGQCAATIAAGLNARSGDVEGVGTADVIAAGWDLR